jgi:hypothetical protein
VFTVLFRKITEHLEEAQRERLDLISQVLYVRLQVPAHRVKASIFTVIENQNESQAFTANK